MILMSQLIQPNQEILKNFPILNAEKITELKARIEKLSAICQDVNPYESVSPELQSRLAEFNILELSDPFKVTNMLLMQLEDSIDELHMLSPLSDAELNNEIL
jgi:hypothetical protein